MPYMLASKAPPLLGTSTRIDDVGELEQNINDSIQDLQTTQLTMTPATTSQYNTIQHHNTTSQYNKTPKCPDPTRELLKHLLMLESYMLRIDTNDGLAPDACISGIIKHALMAEGFAEAATYRSLRSNDAEGATFRHVVNLVAKYCQRLTTDLSNSKEIGNKEALKRYLASDVKMSCNYLLKALGYTVDDISR